MEREEILLESIKRILLDKNIITNEELKEKYVDIKKEDWDRRHPVYHPDEYPDRYV